MVLNKERAKQKYLAFVSELGFYHMFLCDTANPNSMNKKQIITRAIPSDIIIYDILTRVPTESLVRFRCVSKDWSNLFFRDRLFVNLHFQRCNKSTSSGLIDTNNDHRLVFIDPNDSKKKRLMPITVGYGSDVYIQDSLNGLLILACYWISRQDFRPAYYVYNPISNCSISIPKPTKDAAYFRLCYDPIKEKYKVVEVCASDPTIMKIKILTLRHGLGDKSDEDDYSWREIVVPTHGHSDLDRPLRHIYLNGSLYFIIETWVRRPKEDGLYVREFIEPGPVKPYILGLDTNRECTYTIKLPSEVSTSLLDLKNLNEMGGSLCLSQYFRATYELKIWTLKRKDNEDDSEWMETFKIKINMRWNIHIKRFNYIRVLAILTVPKLKVIIMNTDPSNLSTYFSYDMQSEHMEIIHGPIKYSHVHWHVNNIAIGKVQI